MNMPHRFGLAFVLLSMLGSIAMDARRPTRPSRYFDDPAVRDLVAAASRGDIRGIDRAIAAGADVNARGVDGFVPLAYVMLRMNKMGFSALLERGADPNVTVDKLPGHSTSLIGLAAQGDDTFWLEKMIDHGADINVATSHGGWPPINIAFSYNRFDNVRLLVEKGANLEFEDNLGVTPLVRAGIHKKWEAVYILLEAGADWTETLPNGRGIVDFLETYTTRTNIDRSGPGWMWRGKVAQWLKDRGADVPDWILEAK